MYYISIAMCSSLSFSVCLVLQRYWMGVFMLTRTNSCAMPTPSIGVTLSRTHRRSCWWCRPTTATLDVSSARGWKPVQPVALGENLFFIIIILKKKKFVKVYSEMWSLTACQHTVEVHTHKHSPPTSSSRALSLFIHSVCLPVIWKQNHIALDQRVNLSIVVVW